MWLWWSALSRLEPSQQAGEVTGRRRPEAARIESSVEEAFVEKLPTKLWSCDLPGWPGKTIGSSGARWLKRQLLTKLTPASCCRPGPAAAAEARTPAARTKATSFTTRRL